MTTDRGKDDGTFVPRRPSTEPGQPSGGKGCIWEETGEGPGCWRASGGPRAVTSWKESSGRDGVPAGTTADVVGQGPRRGPRYSPVPRILSHRKFPGTRMPPLEDLFLAVFSNKSSFWGFRAGNLPPPRRVILKRFTPMRGFLFFFFF